VSIPAATSVPKDPLVSALHMVEDVAVRFLVATRAPETSSFARPTAAASAARLMGVTSRRSADPVFVQLMVGVVVAPLMAATNRPSPLRNIASSMAGARSAYTKTVKRLLVVVLSTALLMGEEYAASWRDVIV
jgi:hypothetical protein